MKNENPRRALATLACFLISFALYRLAAGWLGPLMPSRELQILADRLSLLIVVGGLAIAARSKGQALFPFFHRPAWHTILSPRLPGRGPLGRPIPFIRFYAIALASATAVMSGLVGWRGLAFTWPLLGFALIFALINALLEETIWRSQLLGQLQILFGRSWAIVITSLGFGLQHLLLGFPIGVALGFALGGLFFALFTLAPRSVYPAMAFHLVINLGMVWSGFIL